VDNVNLIAFSRAAACRGSARRIDNAKVLISARERLARSNAALDRCGRRLAKGATRIDGPGCPTVRRVRPALDGPERAAWEQHQVDEECRYSAMSALRAHVTSQFARIAGTKGFLGRMLAEEPSAENWSRRSDLNR
jgi:hypothetical protein